MILTYQITPKITVGKKLVIPIRTVTMISDWYSPNDSYISVSFQYNKKYTARLYSSKYEGETDFYIKVKPSDYNKFIDLSFNDSQKWFDNV